MTKNEHDHEIDDYFDEFEFQEEKKMFRRTVIIVLIFVALLCWFAP